MCVEQVGQLIGMAETEGGVGIVEVRGVLRRVSLALLVLDGVGFEPGDWLVSHTGLAVQVLSEPEARSLIQAQDEALKGAGR